MAKAKESASVADKIKAQIMETPTASDAQVAALVEDATSALVGDVRAEMGAKHTWEKPKKEKP